jgi:hypothetical protein
VVAAVGWPSGNVPRTPAAVAPKPAAPYGICQDCVKSKLTIEAQVAELATLRTATESAKADVDAMAQRLEASSGVTMLGRQDDTIRRLQRAEEVQRRANDHLEIENRILRDLCDKNKVNTELALTMARVAVSK